jgi:TRAP-type C4-dicarboxylate transport system permease small subunit
MAGVPMWIPHGTVALGFGLILIIAIWRTVAISRRPPGAIGGDEAKP